MPSLDNWTYHSTITISAAARASAAWKRIADRPSNIVLKRKGVVVPAQTVRIEHDDTARDTTGTNTTTGMQIVVIFGVRNHAFIPDTDIRRGDRVVIDNIEYNCVALMTPPGEVQAICEAHTF